jgi:uncharacterized membrane protein
LEGDKMKEFYGLPFSTFAAFIVTGITIILAAIYALYHKGDENDE